jgi:outer membrane lipoprotein-sorting protein
LVVSLLIGCVALRGAEVTTNSAPAVTLDEVSRAMSGVKTVFARFVQERHLSLFQEPLRSEGYLSCEKPGRIRWEITQPYRSVLVSDGSGVAQFEWIDDQWKRLDLGLADAMQHIVSQIAGVIEGRYASNRREFDVTIAAGEGGPVLTLVPQQEKVRKMMRAIEVHLAPDLKGTRRVVLRESNADFTEIRFEEPVIDAVFPPATFNRSKPASLEVIRQAVQPPTK